MPPVTFSITIDVPAAANNFEVAVVLNQALSLGLEKSDTNIAPTDNKGFFVPVSRFGTNTIRVVAETAMDHFKAAAGSEPEVFAHNMILALKQASFAWVMNDDPVLGNQYLAQLNLIADELKAALTNSRME